MMIRRDVLLSAIGLLVLLAVSYPASAAETYKIDKLHTEIRFTYNHIGLTTQAGQFLEYDGSLTFDEAKPEASTLSVTIQAASITTHVPALDKTLRGPDFFDTERHPQITFKSTRVIRTGAKTGRVIGDLTIRGITHPVTMAITFNFGGVHPLAMALPKYKGATAVAFSARTEILRSEFGLGKYAPLTSDAVVISIETEMLNQP